MKAKILPEGYSPQFSGHETFPLRQMWLKKAYDQAEIDGTVKKATFTADEAISAFGVGKNMVASIKHWALACDVLRENKDDSTSYVIPPISRTIFQDGGLDPYTEHPTTAWYAHWWLAGKANRATTWYWLFNHVTAPLFSKEDLELPLAAFARELDPKRKLSVSTLSRDIETCLRSYAPRASGGTPEDFAEPMLGELGLISEVHKGHFSFRRGPKVTLTDGMFAYALADFWENGAPESSSLAFEAIAYGEGSPGRVFKLDEDSIAEHLLALESLTQRAFAWTDSGGLRQVHRMKEITDKFKKSLIVKAYE